MTGEELKEMYRGFCLQDMVVRRYTGGGISRPQFDAEVKGHARTYDETELVGTIQQGDQKVVILAEGLIAAQMPLPVLSSDKIIVADRELAILAALPRRAFDGEIVAYELQARG